MKEILEMHKKIDSVVSKRKYIYMQILRLAGENYIKKRRRENSLKSSNF